MVEWEKYKIGSGDKVEITTVRHVAHVPTASRIVEDGRIKSGLVYDKSVLNKSRISVAWLSANTWYDGSMYGTVGFEFRWDDIVKDQNLYWVEAIEDYKPTAFRILLSKRSLTKYVQPYDPVRDDGPLRLQDGKWFRAKHLTSEFMLEADLSLDRSVELSFENHHPRYCNLHGSACGDIQRPPSTHRTAGRMLAHLLTAGTHDIDRLWKPETIQSIFAPLETGYNGLLGDLEQSSQFGGALRRSDSCVNVVMGSLALYSRGERERARSLLSVIKSKKHFKRALKEVIRRHFDDHSWRPGHYQPVK